MQNCLGWKVTQEEIQCWGGGAIAELEDSSQNFVVEDTERLCTPDGKCRESREKYRETVDFP